MDNKLTTFKHTADGMLTNGEKNPYVMVKDVKQAFEMDISMYQTKQAFCSEDSEAYKEYGRIIEHLKYLLKTWF